MVSPQQWYAPKRTDDEIAAAVGRLTTAGLSEEAAAIVAGHPTWGPVVLGPGVIVSLFPVRTGVQDEAVAS